MSRGRRTFEGSCLTSATPQRAWEVWTDPAAWPGGPIESAQLHGRFEIGGKITTKVEGYRPGTYTITRIERPRLWVNVARLPGLTISVDHVIEAVERGTLLTERATFSGPLAAAVARLMGRRLEATFAATTAHCARLAEA